jgi:riboflavin synthase
MFKFLTSFAQTCDTAQEVWGIPTWYKYLPSGYNTSTKQCELLYGKDFSFTDVSYLLGVGLAVGEILLRIVAVVAVGYIIYGGFQYLISQGEPDRTRAAKDSIVNALVGLVIAILATTIVNFIGTRLSGNAGTTNLGLPKVVFDTQTIPGIIGIIMAIMGAVCLIIITAAGLKYTLSMGDPNATKKAKDTILYAFIGLLVAILATTLVTLVTGRL